ncbi:alpha/beta hydrolase [Eubacteriaceae bacterium ES3]|nr:alpha/beta hydrolase [Eubacteriaceae bacterium ES3]
MTTIYKSEEGKLAVLSAYQNILAAWPLANKQYKVKTTYGDTFVIETGNPENPPLVLLHGSLSNSFSWFSDVPLLSEQYHVFAIDLIGEAGFSAESRPHYKSGAYEQWLDEVVGALDIEQCSIVGLSLGGWMALRYATVNPGKVQNLILLCPGGLATQRRDFMPRMLLKNIFAHGNRTKAIGGALGMDVKAPDKMAAMRKAFEFIQLITKNEKPRFGKLPVFGDAELNKLTMPILVVFGDSDILLKAEKSIERIKRLTPNSTTVLLPGVGHGVLGQAQRILNFLSEHK